MVTGEGSTFGEASDTDQEASMPGVKAAMLEDVVLEDVVLEDGGCDAGGCGAGRSDVHGGERKGAVLVSRSEGKLDGGDGGGRKGNGGDGCSGDGCSGGDMLETAES